MKSKYLCLVTAIVTLSILASCGRPETPVAATGEEEMLPDSIVELREDQIRLAGIETGMIEYRVMNGILKVSGVVDVAPQSFATVCMPMGGFVTTTTMMPGIQVRKNQVLAILENQEYIDVQQDYLEAFHRLEYAEAEFNRHSELYKEDVYSEKNLQQVTADYKSLQAHVRALEQKLSLIGIDAGQLDESSISRSIPVVSPISGYIKSVNVNIGKYVSPSDVMFEIVNSDSLLLKLTLFEKDANKVHEGQKIRFFINNESEEHEAAVIQTAKSINDDKTYTVYALVKGKCSNVLQGMYVNAVIETSGKEAMAVPSAAVVNFGDRDYIFIFDKNKEENGMPFTEYRMVEVKKGVTDGGYTEIEIPADIEIGTAKIVIRGAYNLLAAKKNAGEMAC